MSAGTFEPVKVTPCVHCGFPMKQFNPHSMMMTCEACGARTGDEQQPEYIPRTPKNPLFKLHESFDYRGDTWQIIGCQSYRGICTEWDSEDNAWEKTPWSYHTWWVINAARELAWVVQDKTGYYWSRKAKITSGIPEGDKSYEIGDWTLTSAVGEFSYFPAENEQVKSYEKDGRSLEILLDANGNNKEIEAFTSQPISNMDLLRGFGNIEAMNGLKRVRTTIKAAIACIILLAISFFSMMAFESTLLEIPSKTYDKTSLNKEIQLGIVTVDKSRPLEFSLTSSQQGSNGTFSADLLIKDSDNAVVTELPVEFWRESGSDSDGAWVEDQYGNSPRIVLPKGDNYQLSLIPSAITSWSQISIKGTINKNVASVFPIIIAVVFLVFLIIVLNIKRLTFVMKSTGIRAK